MKQARTPTTAGKAGSTGNQRVATRDLVTIGQRWQRRSRKKIKPAPLVIYQVHRGQDRTVDAYEEGEDPNRKGALQRVKFADLRSKYVLLED